MTTDPATPKTFTDIVIDPAVWTSAAFAGTPIDEKLQVIFAALVTICITGGVSHAAWRFTDGMRRAARLLGLVIAFGMGAATYFMLVSALSSIGGEARLPAGPAPRAVAAEVFDTYYPGGTVFGDVAVDTLGRRLNFTAADEDHHSYECTISAPRGSAPWMTCLPQVQGAARQ